MEEIHYTKEEKEQIFKQMENVAAWACYLQENYEYVKDLEGDA